MPNAHSSARIKAADGGSAAQQEKAARRRAPGRAWRVDGRHGRNRSPGASARPATPLRNSTVRRAAFAILAFLAPVLTGQAGLAAGELRIAAWNLEHLKDSDGEGCVGRTGADYAAIAGRLPELDAGIVALQEVENAAAAHRVFPASRWRVEMSSRPAAKRSRRCRGRPSARLGRLATGFAIRRGIGYRRNPDLKALGMGKGFQRWGTDITVNMAGRWLRLLSVHLISGCWGARQDRAAKRRRTCNTLRAQMRHLGNWAAMRRAEGMAFVDPGGLQPPAGAARRLGVAAALGARAAAPAAGCGCPLALRSPVPGVHRPSGRRPRGGGHAGPRFVPGIAAARAPSGPLRRVGGVPVLKPFVPHAGTPDDGQPAGRRYGSRAASSVSRVALSQQSLPTMS